jgi:HlyD family secretion protein
MKKLIAIIVILLAIGAGGAVFYAKRGDKEPTVSTLQVSRGDIIDAVGATGTLQAVTTVQVGTQVSGIVQEMYADFNSIVKKNQVIARLDPSILQTQVETAKANLTNAQANLERQKVAVEDSQTKLTRAQELMAKNLIPRSDLETAQVTAKTADAQLRSTESQIVQARAAVDKAQVDLDHTVITAPIDGIVISRNVDKGQTVASSMQAPTLFVIAADLTKMQVNANIDESDVGRMRPNQTVTFRVDAYPTETFYGTVQQVRLNPQTVQNVVTYSTVIDVPNQDYKLKPGMTANVTIEIARKNNVLRVPNAALRFRPTADIFAALNQAVPPELNRGFGRGGAGGRGGANGAPGAAASGAGSTEGQAATGETPGRSASPQPGQPAQASAQGQRTDQPRASGPPTGQSAANTRGQGDRGQGDRSAAFQRGGGDTPGGGRGGNMDPEERRRRFEERMAQMTPEEREQFQARMRDRQTQGGGRGGSGGGNFNADRGPGQSQRGGQNPGGPGAAGAQAGTKTANRPTPASATTIDSLFAPLPPTVGRGRVWLYISKQLKAVSLRTGISDGTFTEVLDGNELQVGTDVVTNVVTPEMASRPTTQTNQANNPLIPQRGRPGGPGGGRGR